MHMALVIGGGVVLLGLFVLFGWLWGASAAGMAVGAKAFVPVWLLVAAVNMWVGVRAQIGNHPHQHRRRRPV